MSRLVEESQAAHASLTIKSSAGDPDLNGNESEQGLLERVAAGSGCRCTTLVLDLLSGGGTPSPLNKRAGRCHEGKGKGGGDGGELHFECGVWI